MKKVACLALLFSVVGCKGPEPGPIPTPQLHTPRWAFRPWISKDISTTDDSYDYVGGFTSRQIPIGVLVIDSPWPTDYSTFTPNPVRYHDFAKLVTDMKAQDVRMVMWTTAFMNDMSYDAEQGGDSYMTLNADYDVAHKNGYFVEDGMPFDWWKGTGGSIDFFNDEGRNWWHGLQDQVLELGIAGYKLDFGDEYMTADPVKTAKGTISHQEYSEEYYRDMLAYGVQKLGAEDFTTMVRGYDVSYQWDARFYANKNAAPLVWAGDNRRDWIGLADVLDESFRSAQAGYVVLGWDDGGYLNVDDQGPRGAGHPVFDGRVRALDGDLGHRPVHGAARARQSRTVDVRRSSRRGADGELQVLGVGARGARAVSLQPRGRGVRGTPRLDHGADR